jgi:catechol 2,3-dioxygenase-like lactoylglutathione lyase family enzyme
MFREPFPILHVSDVEPSVALYTEAFGFELDFRWPDEGALEFAFLKPGETGIGIGRAEPPPLPDCPPAVSSAASSSASTRTMRSLPPDTCVRFG